MWHADGRPRRATRGSYEVWEPSCCARPSRPVHAGPCALPSVRLVLDPVWTTSWATAQAQSTLPTLSLSPSFYAHSQANAAVGLRGLRHPHRAGRRILQYTPLILLTCVSLQPARPSDPASRPLRRSTMLAASSSHLGPPCANQCLPPATKEKILNKSYYSVEKTKI